MAAPITGVVERKDLESTSNVKSQEQLICESKGGTWDAINKACILPPTKTEEAPPPKVTPTTPPPLNTFTDVKTGRLSGTQIGDKTFLGLSPQEVTDITTKEASKRELPIGGQAEVVLERQRQELQNQGAGLATSVGATPSEDIINQLQSQISAGEVDYLAAMASAVPGIFPSALGLGGTFAAGALVAGQLGPQVALPEEVITVPAAAIIGGIIGAVKSFYTDFVSDVERQKSELIETPIRAISETKPILGEIINAQNANPENAISNKQEFDNQLAFIDLEYERLKDLTDDSLNAFLGDTGINQIQEFEVFYVLDGERDRLIEDMALALANPDPARIRPTAITIDDIRRRIESELK